MAWITLILAGLFEVGWMLALKYSDGLTRVWPTIATGGALVTSMMLLSLSIGSLPLGTAYAIWTGIGAVGIVILGVILFGESADGLRLACLALIVAGMVGLKLVTPA